MRAPVLALLLLAAPCAVCLFPETVLVSVSETEGGTTVPLPLPAAEGIMDGLFDAGHIVLDSANAPQAPLATLLGEARVVEAGFVLQASVTFERSARGDAPPRFSASARYTVLDTRTGRSVATGVVSGDNGGRETDVDRRKLGFEIGGKIAAAAAARLGGRDSSL
jgi:hypothetical protein